jgi:hypothetical protein
VRSAIVLNRGRIVRAPYFPYSRTGIRVHATGLDSRRGREWWSVSYRINVPRRNDLDLCASNGGVTIRRR